MQYPKKLIHANWEVAFKVAPLEDEKYILNRSMQTLSYQDLIDFWFTEQKDTRHPWRYWYPESNEESHYFIENYWTVYKDDIWAISSALFWNCFQTEEVWEKELETRKAIVTIKRYISDTFWVFEPDWSDTKQKKYHIYYDYNDYCFWYQYTYISKIDTHIWNLSCEEHAQEIMDKFDKELRLIWDIE